MRTVSKFATATALAGALAIGLAAPSEARDGRNAAAIGGFVAGAAIGAAVAGSANRGYYYDDGYAYEPGYRSGYYAYEPAPVYVVPHYRHRRGGCWHSTDNSRPYGYWGAC